MKRISGITYLKAFLPLLVIACHARPFGQSASMTLPLHGVPDWKDVFYSNILGLAVPLFFIITFYLYLIKRDRVQGSTFKLLGKRVLYFFLLFTGWRIVYAIFGIGSLWIPDRGLARNLYHWIFGGGDTLLYYLEQAAYLLVILELICFVCEKFKLSKKMIAILGIGLSVLLIVFCTWFAPETVKIEALRFFSPIGFFPYIFIAILFKERIFSYMLSVIAIAFGVVYSVFEWFTLVNPMFLLNGYSSATPGYAKISVVFVSIGVFGLMMKISKTPSNFAEVLAAISLYVYCIHQIIIVLISRILGNALSGFDFITYLLVAFITYAISFGFYFAKGKYKRRITE